jgi:hypothetical protein
MILLIFVNPEATARFCPSTELGTIDPIDTADFYSGELIFFDHPVVGSDGNAEEFCGFRNANKLHSLSRCDWLDWLFRTRQER